MTKPDWHARLQKAREESEPPVHAWFRWRDEDTFDTCGRCGAIRAKDGSNKPCPGIVKIGLR